MEKFGFVLHPLFASDIARKYPFLENFPERLVERALRYAPPFTVSHIGGVQSRHAEAEGWFVCCPLTSAQMLQLPEAYVLGKIVRAGKLAEKHGAKILGLGAFTSVVGDAGITIAKQLDIAVTTGNSYTVATALEGAREGARRMGLDIRESRVLVLGATGSIGAACAQILAKEAKYLTLAARGEAKLERVARQIYAATGLSAHITNQIPQAVRAADIIIAVTSALDSIIEAEDLKPGAVVCDVARPRSVSKSVAASRDDVLVIEGGVVEVPGEAAFHFDFGFPGHTAYACMAETMILALEGRYENFTLGRQLTVRQIETIQNLAKKHGFQLAGFRSFERVVTDEEIDIIRQNAARKRVQSRDAG